MSQEKKLHHKAADFHGLNGGKKTLLQIVPSGGRLFGLASKLGARGDII